jgi:protein involved in polysaccharide export with SLBB domain
MTTSTARRIGLEAPPGRVSSAGFSPASSASPLAVLAAESPAQSAKADSAKVPSAPGPPTSAPFRRSAPPRAVRIEPVEEEYRIGTQDLLEVQVLGVQDLRRKRGSTRRA